MLSDSYNIARVGKKTVSFRRGGNEHEEENERNQENAPCHNHGLFVRAAWRIPPTRDEKFTKTLYF
jgi:hypothetical protein